MHIPFIGQRFFGVRCISKPHDLNAVSGFFHGQPGMMRSYDHHTVTIKQRSDQGVNKLARLIFGVTNVVVRNHQHNGTRVLRYSHSMVAGGFDDMS